WRSKDLFVAEGRHPDGLWAARNAASAAVSRLRRRDYQPGRALAPATAQGAHALLHAGLSGRYPEEGGGRDHAIDRRHGGAWRMRPGRGAVVTLAAVHAVRNPRRAGIRPAEIPRLDALPRSGRPCCGDAAP